jgi:hypothetical protein
MSDGPHRSLPMCRAWKKAARCADNPAFEVEEIRNAIVPALEQDCRQEVSRGFLAGFRKICSDQQPTLFQRDLGPSLEALRRTAGPGMERLIVDHAIHAAVKGNTSTDIAEKAVADALRDRGARNGRSVEEHFFRNSTERRAHRVRVRIEQGVSGADMNAVAHRVLNGNTKKSVAKLSKRQGLDDGVKL